ncbi:MAG: HsdR family type I site-specific deoxyribonuclease [bacterium]|nr:HsdR family type I site-specific deoxyribonuclease [bacterium]
MILANFDEARQSQLPFVELLLAMGYKYLPTEQVFKERRGEYSKFILRDIAFTSLSRINSYEYNGVEQKFNDKDIWEAIDELENIQLEGLIDTSKKVYNMIMPTSGGKTIKVSHAGKSGSYNFRFIDFEKPENNIFHVAVEFEASGKGSIRPDIVCFVNGIPFVVIENKKSGVDIREALSQMNRNQGIEYCPKLFVYPQLLIGTNGKDIRYGATGTPNRFYATWKEKEVDEVKFKEKVKSFVNTPVAAEVYNQLLNDLNGATFNHRQKIDRLVTEQDLGVVSLLEPARLLDLTKNYIIFDAGVKKIMRYQQYYAVRKILTRIEEMENGVNRQKRKGGLLWATQGSGKSLTMVMLIKALIEHPQIINPRVIIVTDRVDLDKQISETFTNCGLKKKVTRAASGFHLLKLIKEKNLDVVTTLVHKFETASKKKAGFVDESENIFVLVDEAHRTQNGIANLEMNRIIPNACYIGFTGTPLMKKEKASWKKFGGYIDKYTIDDALADKIILPLIYEGRYAEQTQNKEQVDRQIDRVSEELSEYGKKTLQKEIKTRIIKDNPQRIEEIAYDIEKHYVEQFQGTGLKAQIVAPSKFAAILFQHHFETINKIRTAVVISDESGNSEEEDYHKKEVEAYLRKMKEKYQNLKSYEISVIDSFKYDEDGIEVLIVVDKLLTGFDAPCNTVLYLAKDLRDHNLLQAIARVNRLFENKKLPKTAGFIIDYSENAKNLDTAMKLFGNYDDEDVKSTLIDVKEKIEELEKSFSTVHDLFKDVKDQKDDEEYLNRLRDKPDRDVFYKALNEFVKNFNECLALREFVHEFKHIDVYKNQLKKFLELRSSASLKYADREDLTEYKLALVKILDKYIDAEKVELLTKQINIHDSESFNEAIEELGSNKSKAEAIAAQTQRTITEKLDTDPEFYHRFSDKVDAILKKLREGKLADLEALKQMKLISEQVINKKDADVPAEVRAKPGADVFYRNLRPLFASSNLEEKIYIEVVTGIYDILKIEAIVDWYKNPEVKRVMANKIDDYLYDIAGQKFGIKLSNEVSQNVVKEIMQLAEYNYDIFG